MTKTILFAADYSPASLQALHFAASLARDNDATLLIAHVVETEGSSGTDSLDEGSGPSEAQLKELQGVVPTGVPIPCEYKLLYGNPANKIAELAERENVDTIVICAHGHTRLGHLLGGSVAEAVMCQALCAVIAFKPARHVRAAQALRKRRKNMSSMWFHNLICLLRGHHDLCLAGAYGKTLVGGAGKELHYCARCGRAVWEISPPPRRADAGKVRAVRPGASSINERSKASDMRR